jgi:hypothetical protein
MSATSNLNGTTQMNPPLKRPTRELAHRWNQGVDVTLLWERKDGGDIAVICVFDSRAGEYFVSGPP